MRIPFLTEAQKEHFWSRVRKKGPDDCWLWLGAVAGKGYGRFRFQCHYYYAHVMAYYLTFGVWPSTRSTLHSCDTPRCCNPLHLTDGSNGDNNRDCAMKGRHAYAGLGPPGSMHGMTALTEQEVVEIRRLGLLMGPKQIAEEQRFKGRISPSGIGMILRGSTWRHLL